MNDIVKSERENSIGYQIGYTENLFRNNLNRKFTCENMDLTPEQFIILDLIRENPKGISMQAISEKIHRDNSAITRTIDSLEKKDYVIRSTTEKDRRIKIILITPKGEKYLNKAIDIARKHLKEATQNLSKEDLEQLISSLKIIQKNLINTKII